MGDQRQICSFIVSGQLFGIDVASVQEVIRFQEMTRVPLAPPVVEGLINLRGQIVTAIDLRRRLGFPVRPTTLRPTNVVIRTDRGPISLLVDEISDVFDVGDGELEAPPETIATPQRELIRGTYKLADRLMLVLDTTKTLEIQS